jgi:hypothetical protein
MTVPAGNHIPPPQQPVRSRRLLIAVIGVALLLTAALVLWFRSSVEFIVASPIATNANTAPTQPAAPTSPAPAAAEPALASASTSAADPIVGCYLWFNMVEVVIRRDGTMTAGPYTAKWRRTSPAHYEFHWPPMEIMVHVKKDMVTMTGTTLYGGDFTGERTNVGVGLPIEGEWHWSNGWDVKITHDDKSQTFTSGPWSGVWIPGRDNDYMMVWPAPIDTVQMIDNDHIVGSDQYGVTIQGYRNNKCPK